MRRGGCRGGTRGDALACRPEIARRFGSARPLAGVSKLRWGSGGWLPAVSTKTLYGLRSSVHVGVLIGVTVFHGDTTGRSELSAQSFFERNMRTQLSNFASFAFLSSSACPTYFGWNCFR